MVEQMTLLAHSFTRYSFGHGIKLCMPPALKPTFESLKHFLLNDSPTDQETRSALNLIYTLCFGTQAALSIVLAITLAILSQTIDTDVTSTALTSTTQTSNISQIMLFAVMVMLLPSALLIASLWQRQTKGAAEQSNTLSARKSAKTASIASTIAVAVILAISVWLCVFAYFISIPTQSLLLLVLLSIFLYFCGFIAIGIFAKSANRFGN